MNICNIRKTFADYKTKGWDRIYVLVDVHGTVTPSGTHEAFSFVNPVAEEVLRWFSKRPEVRLILWTSSYSKETLDIELWLYSLDIKVDFINENPEAKNTPRACFDQKPYYNIVIDDRAGFEPETDWAAIKEELRAIGEWERAAPDNVSDIRISSNTGGAKPRDPEAAIPTGV